MGEKGEGSGDKGERSGGEGGGKPGERGRELGMGYPLSTPSFKDFGSKGKYFEGAEEFSFRD